jgi:hypothetical protein
MPSGEHESHEARGNARPREMAAIYRIRLTGVLRENLQPNGANGPL